MAQMPWMGGDYPTQTNNTYYYKVIIGEGSTISDAQKKAVDKLIFELSNEHGVNVNSISIHEVKSDIHNGNEDFSEKFKNTTVIEGEGFKTAFESIDEYWEQIETNNIKEKFRCWVLFAVSKNPNNYRAAN